MNVEKINREHMVKAAPGILGVKSVAPLETEAIAQMLVDKFAKLHKDKIARCETCGELSDFELDGCPFCGDGDEDPPAKATNGKAIVKVVSKAIAKVSGAPELDAAVTKVNGLKAKGAHWAWELGNFVQKTIYGPELWRQRVGKDGKCAYKSFNKFAQDELGFAPGFIYQAMKIATFFSEDEAREFGTSYLGQVLLAPKEDHPALLEKIRKEKPTKRGISAEVAEIRKRKNVRVQASTVGNIHPPKKQPAAGAKAAGRPRTTFVVKAGKHVVKLWLKPEKKGAEPEPATAKSLAKGRPYGLFDAENKAEIRFVLQESEAGQLTIVFEPRRKEEG